MLNTMAVYPLILAIALNAPFAMARSATPAESATDQTVALFRKVKTIHQAMRIAQKYMTARNAAFLNQKIAAIRKPEPISIRKTASRKFFVRSGASVIKIVAQEKTETINLLLNGKKLAFSPADSAQQIYDQVNEVLGLTVAHSVFDVLLPRAEAELVLLTVAVVFSVISVISFGAMLSCMELNPTKCGDSLIKADELLSGRYPVRPSEVSEARSQLKAYDNALQNMLAIGCDTYRDLMKTCVKNLSEKLDRLEKLNSGGEPPAILPPANTGR